MQASMISGEEEWSACSCPYLKGCDEHITRYHFNNFCDTGRFHVCFHYAKSAGELNIPITWLQKMAVEAAKEEIRDTSHPFIQSRIRIGY